MAFIPFWLLYLQETNAKKRSRNRPAKNNDILPSINATFFSGFDAYILYWLRDGNPENDPRVYLTSGLLRTLPGGKTLVYPGRYYINIMINRLGQYLPDRVLEEDGDVWIYRHRHKDHPNSLAYFIYKPTINGSRLSSYTFETGHTFGNNVQQISFSDGADRGKEKWLPVLNGKVVLPIEEKPVLLLCRSSNAEQ